MKYRKLTRIEKKQFKIEKMKSLEGTGMFIFENKYDATLDLPKPTKSGVKRVGPKQQFQGDSYYLEMVRKGTLKFVKTLVPEESKIMRVTEEKLILDQPETFNQKGQVEHVVDQNTTQQPLNESDDDPQPEVLINESPADDGFLIIEDD